MSPGLTHTTLTRPDLEPLDLEPLDLELLGLELLGLRPGSTKAPDNRHGRREWKSPTSKI